MEKARIHWVTPDGSVDEVVIEADNLDDLRSLAKQIVEERGAEEYWSSDYE